MQHEAKAAHYISKADHFKHLCSSLIYQALSFDKLRTNSAEQHFAFCHCEHLKGAGQSHTPHEIAPADIVSLAMTKEEDARNAKGGA